MSSADTTVYVVVATVSGILILGTLIYLYQHRHDPVDADGLRRTQAAADMLLMSRPRPPEQHELAQRVPPGPIMA
jgi:hypothetical protein